MFGLLFALMITPVLAAMDEDHEVRTGLRLRDEAATLAMPECGMKHYEWSTAKTRAQLCKARRKIAYDTRLSAARRCRLEEQDCRTVSVCGAACEMPDKLLKPR